jgi:PleD family two-component response regulator
MAERLRRNVEGLRLRSEGKSFQLTVSMGLTGWRAEMGSSDVLLAEVDQALYAAKSNGRNQLAIYIDGQCHFPKMVGR